MPARRLAGGDRVGTAVAISRVAFPLGARRAFLARSDVLADALAAGVLTEGPVLLVPSCGEVPPAVRVEIDRLGATRVTALGGPAAICDSLLRQAAGRGAADRLAGATRTGTAVAVAREAFPDGAEEVYVARASDSPDAVAAGSLTAGPILLTPTTGAVPPEVAAEIARLNPARVVALGGPAALTDATVASAAASRPWIRLAGQDRVGTAVAISAYRFGLAPGDSAPQTSEAATVHLARSDVFADAVAAGSLTDGPVLLVPRCGPLPPAVAAELDRVRPETVLALGGPGAVCEDLLTQAAQAVPDTVVVPDTTVVLDASEQSALTAAEADGTLVFTGDAPAARVRDVVVSAPTPTAPEGLLARVTDVTATADGLVLQTEQAAVTDAISVGFGVARQPLTLAAEVPTGTPGVRIMPVAEVVPGGMTAQALETQAGIRWEFDEDVVLYDRDGDRGTTTDQVVVEGEVVLAGELTALLDVGLNGFTPVVDRFAFAAEIREQADLEVAWGVSLEAKREVTFGPFPLPSFVIPIGPVTVPVVPQLLLTVGARGEVSATVGFGAAQEFSYRVGAEYRDGEGWTPLHSVRHGFDVGTPRLDANAEATLSTTVRIPFKVGGVAGPAVEGEAYLRGTASALPVDWELRAGLRGRAGFDVSFPVLGGIASFSSREVRSWEWLLAEYEPPRLDLTTTGVGPVPLGTPRDEARTRLFALLGPPDAEFLDYGCGIFGDPDGRLWMWGDLIVTADDDLSEDGTQRLEGWAVNGPSLPRGTTVPYGLVPGSARAQDVERALAPDYRVDRDTVFGDLYTQGDTVWFVDEAGVLARVDVNPVFCD